MAIFVGNLYDSRQPGKTMAYWTTGADYQVGSKYYRIRNSVNGVSITAIEPVELMDGRELQWLELPLKLREMHVKRAHPELTEAAFNEAVYGSLGKRINAIQALCADAAWAAVAIQLAQDPGFSLEVQEATLTGIKHRGEVTTRYYSAGRIQVCITADLLNGYRYEIHPLLAVAHDRKVFGRKVASIAREANVSWQMAKPFGNLPEVEAINLLSSIKELKGNIPSQLIAELACGKHRKIRALSILLGDYFPIFEGKAQREVVCDFLLGRIE